LRAPKLMIASLRLRRPWMGASGSVPEYRE
jgi:hypothetical protein